MHPVLFRLGSFTLGTYGLLLLAGTLLALGWLRRLVKERGGDPEPYLDLAFGALLAGVVGAKLLLAFVEWREFLDHPFAWFRDSLRAFGVFYGGFLGAAGYLAWAVPRKKLTFLGAADLFAPPLALAQAVGRLGCFAAGCCHGRPTSLPWGVKFTDPDSLVDGALRGVAIHPVQLYEFLGNLAIALLLARLLKKKPAPGRVFAGWLLLYGASRFAWELFRGDAVRGMWLGGALSTSQIIAAGLVAAGVFLWARTRGTPADGAPAV